LEGSGLCQKLVHLGTGTIPVELACVGDVVGELVGADTHSNLIIRLPVKPEAVLQRSMKTAEINLH